MSDISSVEKVPVVGGGNGVNQPDSPYGRVADLENLKRQFPQNRPAGPLGQPGQQPPTQAEISVPPPGSPGVGMSGRGESPVPGLPRGLFRDTDFPTSGVTGELPAPPAAPAIGPNPAHLQVYEALRQSDDPEAREWAEMMLELHGEGN